MKVAIILCTYNPPIKFLKEQLESIANQSYTNWECFINDDCSSDEFKDQIKNLAADDPRFKINFWETNNGTVYNFERGLNLVTPDFDYVALCDQDDIWHSNKLETMVNLLEQSGLMLAHSDLRVIDEIGSVISESCWKLEKRNLYSFNPWQLIVRNSVTGCATLFKRRLLDRALPFPRQKAKRPTFYHDHWLSICAESSILPIKNALIDYRQHSGNQVGAQRRTIWARFKQFRYILYRIKERIFLINNYLDYRYREKERLKILAEKTKTLAQKNIP
jgi:glycosyltransferase involved in cell wall biosynthesis